jgi:hypothetical protein
MVEYGVFNPEALRLMHAATDQAFAALPPEARTAETRERIARAVVRLATRRSGIRGPADFAAVSLAERASISLGVN